MTAPTPPAPALSQQVARFSAGAGLAFAGVAHLTFARRGFRAQVPPWMPMDADDVIMLSGAVEVALGAGLITVPKHRRPLAGITAAFLAGVFPGNVSQYINRVDGLGLDTDGKRFVRLFFQPLMCAVALHAGGLLPPGRSCDRQSLADPGK